MHTPTALIAATLALAAAFPAQAEAPAQIRVSTADLDLSTPNGQRLLSLRVARAADALCGDPNARFSANLRVEVRQCRERAVATALASVPLRAKLAIR